MSDSFPIIVAFGTGPSRYRDYALRLRSDCEKFGYLSDIETDSPLTEHLLNRPGKQSNTQMIYRYIPSFILRKSEEWDRDILYLHCDFRIQKEIPEEAFEGLDIGLQKRWEYAVDRSNYPMLAAPIFVRRNSRALRFIKMCQAYCLNMDEDCGEHKYLRSVWNQMRKRDRTLVAEYFDPYIASLDRGSDAPIIGHKGD